MLIFSRGWEVGAAAALLFTASIPSSSFRCRTLLRAALPSRALILHSLRHHATRQRTGQPAIAHDEGAVDQNVRDADGRRRRIFERRQIRDLIGVPEEDERRFRVHFETLGELKSEKDPESRMLLYMGGATADDHRAATEYFRELVARRRAEPRDDMVSDLARIPAEDFEGQLDVGALLNEQLGAGQNTTVHLIGGMMALYLTDLYATMLHSPGFALWLHWHFIIAKHLATFIPYSETRLKIASTKYRKYQPIQRSLRIQ